MSMALPIHGQQQGGDSQKNSQQIEPIKESGFVSARNACKLCAPLGASIVTKGIQGAIPLLHGSQGCSTYIRRYTISHFREPLDVASSNFSEQAAVFGGKANLVTAIGNVTRQYHPSLISIATTCLSETIGDDLPSILHGYRAEHPDAVEMFNVSTPAYAGSHISGYWATIRAAVTHFAPKTDEMIAARSRLALIPPFVSSEDLRHLRQILDCYTPDAILFPDYSETLDGPAWAEYHAMPEGGTPISDMRALSQIAGVLEISTTTPGNQSSSEYFSTIPGVAARRVSLPLGIRATDRFLDALSQMTGAETPKWLLQERGRLVDAYVDAHKYFFDKRVMLIADPDILLGLAAFCLEIGLEPVLCGTSTPSATLNDQLQTLMRGNPLLSGEVRILNDTDYASIGELAAQLKPDLILAPSKAYPIAKQLGIPLVRVGFPVHDRFGAQRLMHVGYRGTQQLLDRVANALLDAKQENSDVGYSYQ